MAADPFPMPPDEPAVEPAHVYPVTDVAVGVGTELNPGTQVVPTFSLPLTTFTPVDKITYLQDKAWRNAMAGLYNMIPSRRGA